MAPRRIRSRKQSAASSTAARRLERAVFYLDESIHSRRLVDRIKGMGVAVRHPGEAFPFGTPDSTWLTACGAQGWIVLMRDQRIRYRQLEVTALKEAGVAAFVFTGGAATADETAGVIARLLTKFATMAVAEPKPFLYTFGLGGALTRVSLRR